MATTFHEVPYAEWADLPPIDRQSDLYILRSGSRVDIWRMAHKAVLASDLPQVVHEHDADAAGCLPGCKAVLPGDPPYAP